MILHRVNNSYEQREFVFKNIKRLYKGAKTLFNVKRTVKHVKKKSINDRAVEFTKAVNESLNEAKNSSPSKKQITDLQKKILAGTTGFAISTGTGLGIKKYLNKRSKK